MRGPLFWVDTFTKVPFGGNPACVYLSEQPRSAEWMQNLAREMGTSETAFAARADGWRGLRWFSPVSEVDLCGHATLAAAHVLWEEGEVATTSDVEFVTQSGVVRVARTGDWLGIDLPRIDQSAIRVEQDLVGALGVEPKYAGRAGGDWLVEVESEAEVREMRPNLELLKRLDTIGVIVTSRSESQRCDFILRFFAPRLGIDEDPVTGSAQCSLGPLWGRRLGKTELLAYQASSRGAFVRVALVGERVIVYGHAATVARGEILA